MERSGEVGDVRGRPFVVSVRVGADVGDAVWVF